MESRMSVVPPRLRGSLHQRERIPVLSASTLLPVQRFLHTEAVGGMLLLAAVAVALLWANLAHAGYESFWSTIAGFDLGFVSDFGDYRHWVNDGLMVIFFFVAGAEVKREISDGELREMRKAGLPLAGAAGGMLLPAAVFVAVNLGFGGSLTGWAVPMATDIAFAVGVLALVPGTPSEARVFLLSLAIADDIGAILIIALFYSDGISLLPLLIALLILLGALAMSRLGLASEGRFLMLLPFLWLAVLESGVHPTIAGVALGLATPARPRYDLGESEETREDLRQAVQTVEQAEDEEEREVALGRLDELIRETESLTDRFERNLHPLSSFVVLPIFALANAGILIRPDSFLDAVSTPLFWGIALGLVAGKSIGITLIAKGSVLTGLAQMPASLRWRNVAGTAMLAGIGFTVSLFIATLAFTDEQTLQTAKLAVLLASLTAGTAGVVLLWLTSRSDRENAR
jgi:NhaA family Na+:H+ antiporter